MGTEKIRKAAIVCGGEITDLAWLSDRLKKYDFIIAADSGYDYLHKTGIVPDVLIGDFDSVTTKLPEDIERITFPSHKDKTDFSLCLDYCAEKGIDNIEVYGAWGGRADHSFAAVFALYEAKQNGTDAVIIDEKAEFRILKGDTCYTLQKNCKYISAFAIGSDAIITYKGFEYPLDHYRLPCCTTLGVSNKVCEDTAVVHIHSGYLLLILQN